MRMPQTQKRWHYGSASLPKQNKKISTNRPCNSNRCSNRIQRCSHVITLTLITNLPLPFGPTVMFPVLESITNTPSSAADRLIPNTIVSPKEPLARTTNTSVPVGTCRNAKIYFSNQLATYTCTTQYYGIDLEIQNIIFRCS